MHTPTQGDFFFRFLLFCLWRGNAGLLREAQLVTITTTVMATTEPHILDMCPE